MADIDKLSSDARALKFDLANKVNALKNASSWTSQTYSAEQKKSPAIRKYIQEKTAIQKRAQEDLDKAQVAFDKAIASLNTAKETQRLNPTVEDEQKLIDEANRRGEVYKKPVPVEVTPEVEASQVATSFKDFINTISDPANVNLLKDVQADLAKFGWAGGATGQYTIPFQDFLQKVVQGRGQLPKSLQGLGLREFIATGDPAILGVTAGKVGAQAEFPYTTISNPTQAAATINAVVKNVLNREATPKEIADLTKKLNDAEKKNKTKTVNGVTSGGLNREQFLIDILKVTPEFSKRKTEGSNIDAQTIRETARANLLELSDVQVNNFIKDLKGGQDINTINNRIRGIAAMGMPDSIKKMVADGTDLETIYQPYKTRMAAILELNPQSIDINDSTLRSAIGPDKEMPLYEFEKALRKDSRWQYTNNARDKVSEISARIRRDFGFEA
jgi:hypothetical protein